MRLSPFFLSFGLGLVVFSSCESPQKQMASSIKIAEEDLVQRGDDLPKSLKLADLSGKSEAQINQYIGVYKSDIRDYSAAALKAKMSALADSETRRIAAYGQGRIERIDEQLKIKLSNRTMSLKNEFGEDISDNLSNSKLYEFIAIFPDDAIFMLREIQTGEQVQNNYTEEYVAYDLNTGRRLFAQNADYPSISPDGKSVVMLRQDTKGALLSFASSKEGNWKSQNLNVSFQNNKAFNDVDWQSTDTLLLKYCEKVESSCEKIGYAYYVNGRWFRE